MHWLSLFSNVHGLTQWQDTVPASPELVQNITSIIKLAGLSYCKKDAVEKKKCFLCAHPQIQRLEDIVVIKHNETGMQMVTGFDPIGNRIMISYRGSSNKLNWNQNRQSLWNRIGMPPFK